MDAKSLMSSTQLQFQSDFEERTLIVNSLTLGLSGTVEPVVTQEHKGSLMQYPAQFAKVGQQITHIIATSSDPQTLLADIARALGEIFQVDVCLIVAIVNPAAMTQMAMWSADHDSTLLPGHQAQLLEHPALKDDLAGTDPLAIWDLHACDAYKASGDRWDVFPARAVLRLYTRFQSSVNGTIVLGRSQPHEWTVQEQELLTAVSASVAIAISQVQLTMQVQAATRHQSLLNQLSQVMHSNINLDEILQKAIASTAQTLQVDRGLLLLLKYNNPLVKSKPSKRLPKTKVTVAYEWFEQKTASPHAFQSANTLSNQSFWLAESSLCKQAFRNAPELIAISDQQDAPEINDSSDHPSILEWASFPALAIVPLVGAYGNSLAAPTVLGFIVLQQRQPRSWQTHELELVKWVSAQVSAAIIHNQTLQQVQSIVEDRTAQLQSSLEVQAKLYGKTRQQMDQLQQLNLLKDEFLSSMSHELRTPLTTMSLAIRMLRQPQLLSERREKYLEILEQQCNKEIDLINDLLSLQRLESNQDQLQPEKIDLMLMIEELVTSFEKKWANKRLTLTVESPVRSLILNTDPDSLNRILLELFTNAGKYSHPDTTICLQVHNQVQPSVNQVVLILSNTGPGISPSDVTHIFDKFHRGQGVTQKAVQGTGLGLALVKCLVQHLNGTIEVKSTPSEDSQTSVTSFTLTLPQLQPKGGVESSL